MSLPESTGSPGLFRRLTGHLLRMVVTKVELLQIEIEEEKRRLISILVVTFLAGALFFLGLTLLLVGLAFYLADSYGPLAVAILGGVVTIAGLICFTTGRRKAMKNGPAFGESVNQIKKDIDWLTRQMD